MLRDVDYVLDKLNWMRAERDLAEWPSLSLDGRVWRRALRLASIGSSAKSAGLMKAERLAAEVESVLGKPRGLRTSHCPGAFIQS